MRLRRCSLRRETTCRSSFTGRRPYPHSASVSRLSSANLRRKRKARRSARIKVSRSSPQHIDAHTRVCAPILPRARNPGLAALFGQQIHQSISHTTLIGSGPPRGTTATSNCKPETLLEVVASADCFGPFSCQALLRVAKRHGSCGLRVPIATTDARHQSHAIRAHRRRIKPTPQRIGLKKHLERPRQNTQSNSKAGRRRSLLRQRRYASVNTSPTLFGSDLSKVDQTRFQPLQALPVEPKSPLAQQTHRLG